MLLSILVLLISSAVAAARERCLIEAHIRIACTTATVAVAKTNLICKTVVNSIGNQLIEKTQLYRRGSKGWILNCWWQGKHMNAIHFDLLKGQSIDASKRQL